MKVSVKLFARARDLAGSDCIQVDVPSDARVADLRGALGERLPELRPILPSLLVAVGAEYATDQTPLDAGAEIACFPPVSGG